MPGQGRAVKRRRLRTELRRIREDCGYSREYVTDRMEWSVSKLIRIENGSVGVSANDLKALVELYSVDEGGVPELLDLARASNKRAWWSSYREILSPAFVELIGYEADAQRIWHFQPIMVPGLLQTESYMRAVIAGSDETSYSESEINTRVDIRRKRQEVLAGPLAPAFTVVLDESVLYRRIGDATTMLEQLDRLVSVNEQRTSEVVILPFDAGPHPGLVGVFMVLEFDDPQDADVLFVENAVGDTILKERPQDTVAFRRAFDRYMEIGLRGDTANDFIRQARRRFE